MLIAYVCVCKCMLVFQESVLVTIKLRQFYIKKNPNQATL